MCALYSFPLRRIRRLPQLNSDTKSIIQFLGNMTTPNNSEGIIHANWPDNMVPVAIRVKKYDQWRYNVLGMALYGKELLFDRNPFCISRMSL